MIDRSAKLISDLFEVVANGPLNASILHDHRQRIT